MSTSGKPSISLLLVDLSAQFDAVDGLVTDLDTGAWASLTAAPGWDVRDQIAHLALIEPLALMAVTDPAAFEAVAGEAARSPGSYAKDLLNRGRSMSGPEVLALWESSRTQLLGALTAVREDSRLPWFGPSMSLRSFVVARMMETWAHGWDVAEAIGRPLAATDRLRYIADLGVRTRDWSYIVRNRTPDRRPVFVRLELPSGAYWTSGVESARDFITGDVEDFCLVVTQRRCRADTGLEVTGPAAAGWLDVAQAFAGPATLTARLLAEQRVAP